jgi:hypothetical protein
MFCKTSWRAPVGRLAIVHGIEDRGRPQQARQHGRLVGRHLRGRLAEELARRRVDPIGAGAEIDPVEIQRQDLVLGEIALQPQGQQHLLALAAQGAGRCQEYVLSQLLGDGAAALGQAPVAQVDVGGAREADEVEPEMAVEAPVLGGQHGLRQVARQVLQLHRGAVEVAIGGDHLAVLRQERDARLFADLVEAADVRQVVGQPAQEHERHQRAPAGAHQPPTQEKPRPSPASPRSLLRLAVLLRHYRLSRRFADLKP